MNTYTKKARSVAEYTMMRGVTDFSNAAQFNMYEKGYSFLFIITKPKFIEVLASQDDDVKNLANAFYNILQFEFKGLDGIDNITADTLEFTDGISTMNAVGKVNMQSAADITMSFTEKSGTTITKFTDYYIRGIRDPRTQAKTYHGLIRKGILAAGFENEVFNLLYINTDNTMLQVEKAYLLANAWITTSNNNIYQGTKDDITSKADIDLTFQCFILDGPEVDKRANMILASSMGKNDVYNVAHNNTVNNTNVANITTNRGNDDTAIKIDSSDENVYSAISTNQTTTSTTANALQDYADSLNNSNANNNTSNPTT